ncbi:MAG: hypothetical protein IKY62_04060, partial [Clostridia bacterium]|nr:hypothetical protein [Clostridia bacterium]
MAHDHGTIQDRDPHFTINTDTRALATTMKKVSLIKGDHNSERFSFDIPSTIEDHETAKCDRVEVHFINTDMTTKAQSKGAYAVSDVALHPDDPTKVTFSWLIDERATRYQGTLSFVVRFLCVDNNVLTYAWSTAVYTGITVADGIDNGEAVFPDPTTKADLLEDIRQLEASIADIRSSAEAGNFCALFTKYALEPNTTIAGVQSNYKDSFPIRCFNRRPVVGDIFFGVGRTVKDKIAFSITARVTGFNEEAGNAAFEALEVIPMDNCGLFTTYALEPLGNIEDVKAGDTNSFRVDCFNRMPVVGDIFFGMGRTRGDKIGFGYTARVLDIIFQEDYGKAARYEYIEVIPMANAVYAEKATKDGNGNVISDTYAKSSDLTNGTVTVDKATKDGNGKVISETYLKKAGKKYLHQILIVVDDDYVTFNLILSRSTSLEGNLNETISEIYDLVGTNKKIVAHGERIYAATKERLHFVSLNTSKNIQFHTLS